MILKEYVSKDTTERNRVFVEVECSICKSIFIRQKRQLKTHTCSAQCLSLLNNTSKTVACAHCNIVFNIPNKRYIASKSKLFFCSREHKDIGQTYIKEIQPSHYGLGNGKYNYRERAIRKYGEVCQICGFNNPLAIVVHHIDHDRNNNDLENLIVLCANCHYIAHEGNFSGE